MKTIRLWSLGLLLLATATAPALAAETLCSLVRVALPADWEVIKEPEVKDGLCSAVYGAADHTASVMVGMGKANSLSASDIARDVAALLNVKPVSEEHLELVRFSGLKNTVPVTCSVGADTENFIFACTFGDQNRGSAFIRKQVSSPAHKALLPK